MKQVTLDLWVVSSSLALCVEITFKKKINLKKKIPITLKLPPSFLKTVHAIPHPRHLHTTTTLHKSQQYYYQNNFIRRK